MRIAIIVPLVHEASGGFEKHLKELVAHWRKSSRISDFAIFTPTKVLNHPDQLDCQIVQVNRRDFRNSTSKTVDFISKNYDVALVNTARPVALKLLPTVTMVRNIEPIQRADYPMPLLWKFRRFFLRKEHEIACKNTTRILAVSAYVKEQICREFRISQEKVDVVYHGIDLDWISPNQPVSIHSSRDFIFCAGGLTPYRGFEDIIRAIAMVRSQQKETPLVVLAGGSVGFAQPYEHYLRNLIKKLNVEDLIIWTGQLRQDEMVWCYINAKMFVQTSRAESFSNTQLEAMAYGSICISCNQPPMPEILEKAALYYPTGDVVALAEKIRQVLNMRRDEVESWRKKARNRASQFSGEKCTEQTLDVLECAISHYSGS